MKTDPVFATVRHDPSGSLLHLQIENVKGRTKITDSRFSRGNVANLTMVRRILAEAKQEMAARER